MIYPAELPIDKVNHPEGDVFRALRRVSDKYDIFYERRFSGTARGERKDYEIDFIVAKPGKAILILEAKGGLVEFRGIENAWYRNGNRMKRNPVDQVSSQWDSLIARFPWLADDIPFEWGLVFPNCEKRLGQRLPDSVHPGRVLDQKDLLNIEGKLNGIFHDMELSYTRLNGTTKQNYERFKTDFLKSYSFQQVLSTQIEQQEQTFIEFTDEQKDRIEGLWDSERAVISGVAGSGKTVVAQSMAERFSASGAKVLYLCFNRALANITKERFKSLDLSITADTFHSYAEQRIERMFSGWYNPPEDRKEKKDWFELEVPAKLDEVINFGGAGYDLIVLDEGQDFSDIWIEQLIKELKEEGQIFVFMDAGQDLFNRYDKQTFKGWAKYRLGRNCRNTVAINQFINSKFKLDIEVKNGAPDGDKVEERSFEDLEEIHRFLDAEIRQLIKQGKIRPEQIMLLSNLGWNSVLGKIDVLAGFPVKAFNKHNGIEESIIHHSNSRIFKGLESDVVFLVEEKHSIDNQETTKQKLYVLATRAKHRLYYCKIIT
jgi:hypothetical protein